MRRPDTTRVIAILVLTFVLAATLIATGRHDRNSSMAVIGSATTSDLLSVALRHCNGLGPKAEAKAHCQAIWEENRRRFFALPMHPDSGASPNPMSGDAR